MDSTWNEKYQCMTRWDGLVKIPTEINANIFSKAVDIVKGFFAADSYEFAGAMAA